MKAEVLQIGNTLEKLQTGRAAVPLESKVT